MCLMCMVCVHIYLHCLHQQAYSTAYLCYTTNTVLIHKHDSPPENFRMCLPTCTHAHTLPILLCVDVKGEGASWFLSWVVSHENQRAFLCIPRWGEQQGWEEACRRMSVTYFQTTLDQLSEFKEAAIVLDSVEDFNHFSYSCKPSRGCI